MNIKLSHTDWESIGKQMGWLKEAQYEGESTRELDKSETAAAFINERIMGVDPEEYRIRIRAKIDTYESQSPRLLGFDVVEKPVSSYERPRGSMDPAKMAQLDKKVKEFVFGSEDVSLENIKDPETYWNIKSYIMENAKYI